MSMVMVKNQNTIQVDLVISSFSWNKDLSVTAPTTDKNGITTRPKGTEANEKWVQTKERIEIVLNSVAKKYS